MTINSKLVFLWDDIPETCMVTIFVPDTESFSKSGIMRVLHELHTELDQDLTENLDNSLYGKHGRTPETLLNYMKQQHPSWDWKPFQFDNTEYFD